MKVKLFTHTDLDGVGCAIMAHCAFDHVDVSYCDYNEINHEVSGFIDSEAYKNFDQIFITDISINEEVAEKIEAVIKGKTTLLDHHETAEWLNKYSWAKVNEKEQGIAQCGTLMLYQYLSENNHLLDADYKLHLNRFAANVRLYDTWEWYKNKDELPKKLNDLLYFIGRDRFVDRFVENPSIEFTEGEKLLLEVEEERIHSYINQKAEELRKTTLKGNDREYQIGVVFADRYISQVGNQLAENNPDLDFICIFNLPKSISLRGVKDEIHLGEVAKKFGGGGHPKASGIPINNNQVNELLMGFVSDVFESQFAKLV